MDIPLTLSTTQFDRLNLLLEQGRLMTREVWEAHAEPIHDQLREARAAAVLRQNDRPCITGEDALEAVVMVCDELPAETTQAVITEAAAELLGVCKADAAAPVSKAIAMLMHSGEITRDGVRFGRTYRITVNRFLTPRERHAAIIAAELAAGIHG